MGKIRMFEDFVPVGFGTNNLTSFAASGRNINTGYNMDAFVGPALEETCNKVAEQAYAYEANDNPEHTAEGYIKEAKDLINKRIDEACEGYGATNEASDYEFDPNAAAQRLKKREQENIQRYRAAQDRGDNYAIALYELKIKMDKIDLEGLKVQTAIHDLKKKYGK